MSNDSPITPEDVSEFISRLSDTDSAPTPHPRRQNATTEFYSTHLNCGLPLGNAGQIVRGMFHDMHSMEPEYFIHAMEHFISDIVDLSMALGAYHALDDLKNSFDDELARGTSASSSCRCENETHQAVHGVFHTVMTMVCKIVQHHKARARFLHDETLNGSPFTRKD
jgi:hypothetical protein